MLVARESMVVHDASRPGEDPDGFRYKTATKPRAVVSRAQPVGRLLTASQSASGTSRQVKRECADFGGW